MTKTKAKAKPKTKAVQVVTETPKEKKYHSIGLTGDHETIRKFRGILKIQNKKLGDVILEILEDYNSKVKF